MCLFQIVSEAVLLRSTFGNTTESGNKIFECIHSSITNANFQFYEDFASKDIEICFGKGNEKNPAYDENFHYYELYVNSIDDLVDISIQLEDTFNGQSEDNNFSTLDNISEIQADEVIFNCIDFIDESKRPAFSRQKVVDSLFFSPAASSVKSGGSVQDSSSAIENFSASAWGGTDYYIIINNISSDVA